MAMFDMADLVYLAEGRRLKIEETPLGRSLLADGIVTRAKLQDFHRDPLRYARAGERRSLHYLPLAGEGRDLDWARELVRRL